MEQYATVSKYDRVYGSLKAGNSLTTKPSTIKTVEPITGEAETFTVETIRAEQRRKIIEGLDEKEVVTVGDFIVIEYTDKGGHVRLILPPKVAATIERQHKSLSDRARRIGAKAAANERKLQGIVPFVKKVPLEV